MQCHKVIHDPTTTLQNISERNVIFLDVMSSVCKMVNQCFKRLYHLQAAVSLEIIVITYSLHSCPIPENCSLILTLWTIKVCEEEHFVLYKQKVIQKKTCILLWNPYLWFVTGAEDLKIKVRKMIDVSNLT